MKKAVSLLVVFIMLVSFPLSARASEPLVEEEDEEDEMPVDEEEYYSIFDLDCKSIQLDLKVLLGFGTAYRAFGYGGYANFYLVTEIISGSVVLAGLAIMADASTDEYFETRYSTGVAGLLVTAGGVVLFAFLRTMFRRPQMPHPVRLSAMSASMRV